MRATKEKNINNDKENQEYYYRNKEVENESNVINLIARMAFYKGYLNDLNKDYSKNYENNRIELLKDKLQENINNEYDKYYKDDQAFAIMNSLPKGEILTQIMKTIDKNVAGYKFTPSSKDLNSLTLDANQTLLTDPELLKLQQKKTKFKMENR